MEWISVKDRYPENGQSIKIKIWDDLNDCECIVEAKFIDYEDYRSWTIEKEFYKERKLIARPTHWMPLPNPPKENL